MQHTNVISANLNLLVTLDALLTERSVTRAAVRLGLSQPATSHALARLRALFDDPLLVRGQGGLVPTPLAESLAGPLRAGLAQLEQVLTAEPGFDPATSTRTFTVATVDYVCLTALRTLVERFGRIAPGVRIEMVSVGPRLADQLEQGRLDVVLAGVEVEAELGRVACLRRSRVASEDFRCIVRCDNPNVGERLDLDTYLSLAHVTVSTEGGACDHHVDSVLAERGLQRRIAAAVPHFLGAPLLVAASDVIATLPRALCEQSAAMLPVRLLEPPIELPRGEADLWWHERMQDDPGHRWWREQLTDAFAPYRLRDERPRKAASPR